MQGEVTFELGIETRILVNSIGRQMQKGLAISGVPSGYSGYSENTLAFPHKK